MTKKEKEALLKAAELIKEHCTKAKGCSTCPLGYADGKLHRCAASSYPHKWELEKVI